MTKEKFEFMHDTAYKGKHEKRHYNVWRVLGPAGPQQTFVVYGLEEAAASIDGVWDWDVTYTDGDKTESVPYSVLKSFMP